MEPPHPPFFQMRKVKLREDEQLAWAPVAERGFKPDLTINQVPFQYIFMLTYYGPR